MKKFILFIIMMIPFAIEIATQESMMVKMEVKPAHEIMADFREEQRQDSIKLAYRTEAMVFLTALAIRESGNNPDIVNSYGYIGKYQFGRAALKDVGLDHITYREFVKDKSIFPEALQDSAVITLMKLNEARLGRLIDKHEFTVVKEVYITRAGLLAAAHLAGAGGVRRFLNSHGGHDPADGYGTKLSTYLREFSGYDLDLAMI